MGGGVAVTKVGPAGGEVMRPPSLRRRAPARVEVTDAAGRLPRMSAGVFHVRAGKKLRVKVVPQPTVDKQGGAIRIKLSEGLRAVVDPCSVKEGPVQACYAEVVARHRSQWPLPQKAHIHVTVSEPGAVPFELTIPVAVWPSVRRVLAWGVLTVGVALLSARYLELARTRPPTQALLDVGQDSPFLAQTLALGLGVSLLIHLFGWAVVRLGVIAGDDG